MRLTKSTGHAIRILLDCAGADDRLIKVAELSERLQITQQNVFKIVNLLAREGLIEAVRGRNGGVRLARGADQIRIGDVVRATEITRVEVEDAPSRKQKTRSGVNEILDDALGAFIDVLDQPRTCQQIDDLEDVLLRDLQAQGQLCGLDQAIVGAGAIDQDPDRMPG